MILVEIKSVIPLNKSLQLYVIFIYFKGPTVGMLIFVDMCPH